MRKILILLLLIIAMASNNNLQAQKENHDYIPLLDTNKMWTEAMQEEFYPLCFYDSLHIGDTVMVNDTVFYEIFGNFSSLSRYLREDTVERKVYGVGYEPSGSGRIMYDFSMEVGDSIYDIAWTDQSCVLYLDSIKLLNYFGKLRRTFYFHSNWNSDFFRPIWVEGIGSLAGIFRIDATPGLLGSMGQTEINCVYLEDELIYQSYWANLYGCYFEYLDTSPPVLIDAWFEPYTVADNDTTTLYINAYDVLSGISSIFTVITSPSGVGYVGLFDNIVKISDSLYSLDLEGLYGLNSDTILNTYPEVGNWNISTIRLWDNQGNAESYFINVSFYVSHINNINTFMNYDKIKLQPNPANDYIELSLDNFNNNYLKISIYDLYGKLIKQIQTKEEKIIIDISSFKSGLYLCKLTNNKNQIMNTKFIKL